MSAIVYVALGMVLGWCLHGRLTRNAAEQLRIVKARERVEREAARHLREVSRVKVMTTP
jgi:hypothetical protein